MKKQKAVHDGLTAEESKLIEGLRRHPDMMARVQSILEIARNEDGPLKTADQVEELLIEEMRRLGQTTMSQWAQTFAGQWPEQTVSGQQERRTAQ